MKQPKKLLLLLKLLYLLIWQRYKIHSLTWRVLKDWKHTNEICMYMAL